jgi:hypothetical protein
MDWYKWLVKLSPFPSEFTVGEQRVVAPMSFPEELPTSAYS